MMWAIIDCVAPTTRPKKVTGGSSLSKELAGAIRARDTARVAALIAGGASVNTPSENGIFPLFSAVSQESPGVVAVLLRAGADVNAQNAPNQGTALQLACYRCHYEIAKMLIDAGADLNAESSTNVSPLGEAVRDRTANHLKLTRRLIQAGADVNASKTTPILTRAARGGSPEIVTAVIEAGAEINAVRRRGTALTMAIEENRPENVAVLLAHGADVTLRTPVDAKYPNLTAMELATKLKLTKIVKLLGEGERFEDQPAPIRSVVDSWAKIVALLKKKRPNVAKSLRKGAKAKELQGLETLVGLSLPEEFQEFYVKCDGQSGDAEPLVPAGLYSEDAYRLLPLEEIAGEWTRWKKLTEVGEFKDLQGGASKGIRDDWWNVGWIPFADNGNGDLMCVDLAPDFSGTNGQIITVNHESPKRELLAPCISLWLQELAGRLTESEE